MRDRLLRASIFAALLFAWAVATAQADPVSVSDEPKPQANESAPKALDPTPATADPIPKPSASPPPANLLPASPYCDRCGRIRRGPGDWCPCQSPTPWAELTSGPTTEPFLVPGPKVGGCTMMPNAQCASPFMIGSAFGGGTLSLTSTSTIGTFRVPNPSGGVVGRTNLAEGFNPLPRDRVFMYYDSLYRVPLIPNDYNVNRYTPGFEKTFLDGMTSFEFRAPFAGTMNTTYAPFSPDLSRHIEMGDLFGAFKVLVAASNTFAFSAGTSMTVPLADNVRLTNFDGNFNDIILHDQTVRLQPFAGLLLTPNDRFFAQGLLQVDIPMNTSTITFVSQGGFLPDQKVTWHDQTYLNTSVSSGYWIYRDRYTRNYRPFGFVTGLAPILEAHYSQTVNGGLSVSAPAYSATLSRSQLSLFNIAVGLNVQFGPLTSLILGYSTPWGSGNDDRQFDGQFNLLFNHRFGPQNRLSRVQF